MAALCAAWRLVERIVPNLAGRHVYNALCELICVPWPLGHGAPRCYGFIAYAWMGGGDNNNTRYWM